MKLNIYNYEGIFQLKRNQKLKPNKLFLIGSESVTNSLYFRRPQDLRYAHKVIVQRLSGILEVLDYLFTPKGWLLIVKFKSENKINNYYRRMRGYPLDKVLKYDVGKIISEVIRTTISSLVNFINKGSNRKGTLVYRSFKRFSITSISAVKLLIAKMKRQEIILSNQKKQFKPSIKFWKNNILPKIGMSFLSSGKQLGSKKNVEFEKSSIKLSNISFKKEEFLVVKSLVINVKMLM